MEVANRVFEQALAGMYRKGGGGIDTGTAEPVAKRCNTANPPATTMEGTSDSPAIRHLTPSTSSSNG